NVVDLGLGLAEDAALAATVGAVSADGLGFVEPVALVDRSAENVEVEECARVDLAHLEEALFERGQALAERIDVRDALGAQRFDAPVVFWSVEGLELVRVDRRDVHV